MSEGVLAQTIAKLSIRIGVYIHQKINGCFRNPDSNKRVSQPNQLKNRYFANISAHPALL